MPNSPLTLRRFTRFYAPLAATSLLLTATNPLLTSAMSRSVNPAVALAGFGVALSLCGVLYSPLLVGQQVAATKLLSGSRFRTDSASLVSDRHNPVSRRGRGRLLTRGGRRVQRHDGCVRRHL